MNQSHSSVAVQARTVGDDDPCGFLTTMLLRKETLVTNLCCTIGSPDAEKAALFLLLVFVELVKGNSQGSLRVLDIVLAKVLR